MAEAKSTPAKSAPAKTAADSAVIMTEMVLPSDANPHGTVFGGKVMQWVDIAAAIVAHRHCRMPVVTVSMDDVHFRAPIRIGQVALLRGQMNAAFHTSVEIGVEVESEDPFSGERRHCLTAYVTFVAIGADDHPAPVPPLRIETDDERRRLAAAEDRRRVRLARRKALDSPTP